MRRPQCKACLNCEFESRRQHGSLCLMSVVCCQEQVSTTWWSLVQRSPAECGLEAPYEEAMTRNRVEAPHGGDVCVCIKMPFVRLYSMRLQQLQKIIRPSIQNIVRICKQIITITFGEASNRSVVVKFVNTSTKILVIVVPTDFFMRTDFISYILSYLYLKYRHILMTYSHSNQCNVPWFIWSNQFEYPPRNQFACHFHWQ